MDSFVIRPRLPLIDLYAGECRAQPLPWSPGDARLKSCNTGYSRATCEHFPVDSAVDAIRFHVTPDSAGATLTLHYVLERDCWPVKHGLVTYSKDHQRLLDFDGDPILQRQAEAFAESFLRATPAGAVSAAVAGERP